MLKAKIFRVTIEPVLLYGCDTWSLTSIQRKRLTSAWFKLLRWSTNTSWKDKRSNGSLLAEFKLPHPLQTVRERFLGLIGHTIRRRVKDLERGLELTPLCRVITWQGIAERRYSNHRGATLMRFVQRRGQGNRQTILKYCLELLGLEQSSVEDLVRLASCKEAWRARFRRLESGVLA